MKRNSQKKKTLLQELKDFVKDEWEYKIPSDYDEEKTKLLIKLKKIIKKYE